LPALNGSALTGVGVDGIVSTANATAITIDSSENVGIKNISPNSYDAGARHLVIGSPSEASLGMTFVSSTNGTIYWADGTTGDEKYRGAISYNHANDYMQFRTGGFTERLRINSSGVVTMPGQTAFMVHQLTMPQSGASGLATGGTTLVNIGGIYATSNGRFTAPVAGTYLFCAMAQEFGAGSGNYIGLSFEKNGSAYGADAYNGIGGTYNNHHTVNMQAIFNLSINDYVNMRLHQGARNGTQNFFAGHLIG
jgi:hypothetical protein